MMSFSDHNMLMITEQYELSSCVNSWIMWGEAVFHLTESIHFPLIKAGPFPNFSN